MSVKKGQLYEGTVTDFRFPNRGKVLVGDSQVLVKGTIPGQKISFHISRKRAGTSEGRLCEVLERSPLENEEPFCPHFEKCGGCTYQRLSYENQLQLKSNLVKGILDGIYSDYDFHGITGSPSSRAYRNKMEFTFGDESKGGTFALGLHRKESFHDIVNIRECGICHPDFDIIRNGVRDFFNALYIDGLIDFYNQYTHRGYLRHLLVRRSAKSGEILVALITTTPGESNRLQDEKGVLEQMLSILKNLPLEGHIAGVCHVCNDGMSDVVRNEGTEILFGQDYITEEILGLKFKISLFSFFQTNSPGCERLYEKVREFAAYNGGGVIYDLYSGTGTIAQIMSPSGSWVYGVEIVEDAVDAARINAELNAISNVSFIAGDVMKVLCGEEGNELPKPDLIILDPPREGIHPKALGKILGYGVERIVYISCKPTSLAEDLQAFKIAGYKLEKAACVDMFPGTVHVETVVLMSRVSK